ncbi:hypothetical protein CYMTET_19259 [Cymbomonas tetramitiformis]|uniref:Uncharacterized protein n=1 Tax=Cymbomonas tetramitiformis TaxID=36881 RepID=A0AAE0L552_9CHLO|nr:hypothetical protein CYMTET_19259 [Cymbomonas tetramitiformis]
MAPESTAKFPPFFGKPQVQPQEERVVTKTVIDANTIFANVPVGSSAQLVSARSRHPLPPKEAPSASTMPRIRAKTSPQYVKSNIQEERPPLTKPHISPKRFLPTERRPPEIRRQQEPRPSSQPHSQYKPLVLTRLSKSASGSGTGINTSEQFPLDDPETPCAPSGSQTDRGPRGEPSPWHVSSDKLEDHGYAHRSVNDLSFDPLTPRETSSSAPNTARGPRVPHRPQVPHIPTAPISMVYTTMPEPPAGSPPRSPIRSGRKIGIGFCSPRSVMPLADNTETSEPQASPRQLQLSVIGAQKARRSRISDHADERDSDNGRKDEDENGDHDEESTWLMAEAGPQNAAGGAEDTEMQDHRRSVEKRMRILPRVSCYSSKGDILMLQMRKWQSMEEEEEAVNRKYNVRSHPCHMGIIARAVTTHATWTSSRGR